MAETNLKNSTTVVLHSNLPIEPAMNENNTNIFKRKLDKLKSKFFELFFSANSSCSKPSTNESNKFYIKRTISTNTLNSSMLISNCYYGYKSSLIETSFVEEIHSNSSNKNRILNKISLSSSSSSLKNSPISQRKKTAHVNSSSFSPTSSIEKSSSATTAVTSEFNHKTNSKTNINSLITIINTGYYSNINNTGCVKEDAATEERIAQILNEAQKQMKASGIKVPGMRVQNVIFILYFYYNNI